MSKKQPLSPPERKRKFLRNLRVYLAMSIFFVLLNLFGGSDHFWAIYPILGWGLGILMEGLAAYGPLRERENEYPSDDEYFDLDRNRPDKRSNPEPLSRNYREEDLI